MANPNRSRPEANMFTGSVNPSFLHSEFKAAGHDIFSPTFNVNFTAPPPTHDDIPEQDVPRRRPPASTSKSPRSQALKGVKRLLGLLSPRHQQTERPSTRLLKSSYDSDDTPPLTPGSSCASSPFSSQEDITVSPAEDLDPRLLESQNLTTPQVYVRSMLKSGKGLACWKPRPRKPNSGPRGTVPGDVGTFSAEGGFKKIFNIWDDEGLLRHTTSASGGPHFRLSPKSVVTEPEDIPQGSTIADGVSSQTILSELDASKISSFEFRCHSRLGAVLAATSSAELEELENYNEMQEAIIRHPELIYTHANAIRRMSDDEPLYIITGCIKSDSWAIAALREALPAPHNVMSLQNMTRAGDVRSKYVWTRRSTSEAYFGSSEVEGVKDQTLFLRGFKLDFSQAFRARMKRTPCMLTNGPSGSGPSGPSDASKGAGDNEEPGRGRGAQFGGRDGGQSNSNGSHSSPFGGNSSTNAAGNQDQGSSPYPSTYQRPAQTQLVGHDVSVKPFPGSLQDSCHPSDAINKLLLYLTGADFALCHDDEWRFALDGLDSPYEFIGTNINNLEVDVCNGVAMLSRPLGGRCGGSPRLQLALTSSTDALSPSTLRVQHSPVTSTPGRQKTSRSHGSPSSTSLSAPIDEPTRKQPTRKRRRKGLTSCDTSQPNQSTSAGSGKRDLPNVHPLLHLQTQKRENKVLHDRGWLQVGECTVWPARPQNGQHVLAGTELCASDLHYYMHGRNSDFLVRSPVLGYPASSGLNGRSSSGGAAKYGPVIGDLPPLGTPISAAGVNSTRASSPSEPSADVAKSPPNEGCSWVTVVCSECKRLKIKGDPKSPCGTCMRREVADGCTYAHEALNRKVDIFSLSDRLQALDNAPLEFALGARIDADLDLDAAITALHIQGDGRTEPPRPSGDLISPRLSSPLTGSGGESNDNRSIGAGEFAHLYGTIGVPEGHTATKSSQDNLKPWAASAASPRFLKDAARAKSGCYTCRIRRKKGDSNKEACQTCHRLRLEHLGFGSKQPEWLVNQDVVCLREQTKEYSVSHRFVKSVAGAGPGLANGRPRTFSACLASADPGYAYDKLGFSDEGSLTTSLNPPSQSGLTSQPESLGDETGKPIYGRDSVDDGARSTWAHPQAFQASTMLVSEFADASGTPGESPTPSPNSLDNHKCVHTRRPSPSTLRGRRLSPLPTSHRPSRPPEDVKLPPLRRELDSLLHPAFAVGPTPPIIFVELYGANESALPSGLLCPCTGNLDPDPSGYDSQERVPRRHPELNDRGGEPATQAHNVFGWSGAFSNGGGRDANSGPTISLQVDEDVGALGLGGTVGGDEVHGARDGQTVMSSVAHGQPILIE